VKDVEAVCCSDAKPAEAKEDGGEITTHTKYHLVLFVEVVDRGPMGKPVVLATAPATPNCPSEYLVDLKSLTFYDGYFGRCAKIPKF